VPSSNEDFFQWAPDSSRIAFLADPVNNDVFELFTTLPTGPGGIVKLSDDLSGDLDVQSFKWAPDSSRVAFLADQDINNVIELYSSLPDGSVKDKVSVPLIAGQTIFSFTWAPDSSLIAYIADQDTVNVVELYTAPPDGSANNLVSAIDPIAVPGSNVTTFSWAPDSTLIAYLADQETNDVNELFTSPPDGSGNDKVSFLDPIAVPDGDVLMFIWAPDSSRIAYRADQDTDNVFELYSSLPDGSVNNLVSAIDPIAVPGSNVVAFKWAPDSSRIAYVADQDTDNVFELFSSPADGSGNGNISGLLVPNGNVSAFEYEP
jgi:Tol biopolymer transport system component